MPLDPPAEVGAAVNDVDTPALLLDLDAFEHNLQRMTFVVRSAKVRLRPHAKSHKCPEIALRQIQAGAVGVCCQKVSEAEALVDGGVADVFVTNEIVGKRKLARLAMLATRAKVSVCVDDADNVDALSAAVSRHGVQLECLVEIDCGAGRCGVEPGIAAVDLARRIDSADGLFIMLEGRVKVFVSDAQGHEVILGTHGPGEYFGEMSLDTGPRSASVITLEPCQLLVVPKDAFREFIEDHPAFAFSLIGKLIARVRTLTENVKSLALMDVYGRIARLLLELADEREGVLVIAERLTQQEIANRVGASREMVSRIMKDLTTGGYITQSREGIVLHRRPPLNW